MAWKLTFYSPKVAEAVEAWPVGVRARFLDDGNDTGA
jgi:hypothetical protein